MKDERPICDSWAAPISLLAAAALSAEEERDVRWHLADCAACRERFEQLVGVAGRLRAVRAGRDVRAGRTDRSERPEFDLRGIVVRTMSQVADEQATQRAATRQSGADRRWSSWALVALTVATCLTAAVLVARRSERSAPRDRNLARNVAPGESIEPIQSIGPTLAELRHAAAESDEALDQLLASRSVTLSAESLSFQSLWQESL